MTNSDELNQSSSAANNSSPSFLNSSSLTNTNSNSSNVSTSSANLNSNSFSVLSQSHNNSIGQNANSPLLSQQAQQSQASAKHPLSNSKHLCVICGDRSSGKHYGTFSCEGCKGFFKRTVRKDLTYACREDRNCMIDKRQRNRCQFCRYNKCLAMGMKREAVQEERQRNKDREKNENQVESTCNTLSCLEMPAERILQAEQKVEVNTSQFDAEEIGDVNQAITRQLYQLILWAKNLPHFNGLSLGDQVILLKAGWNELLIASLAHRSMCTKDSIQLASGLVVSRHSAAQVGVGCIFDRVLSELVSKMKQLSVDKTELGCLRCIVLFNPEAKGLKNVERVEQIRESVYVSLENYTKLSYPEQQGRFAKLLLRLPALRSVALKCVEYLFFNRLNEAVKRESSAMAGAAMTVDAFLISMLERNTIDL